MISLSLDTPEELAEAIYLSELSVQMLSHPPHHGEDWQYLSEETKTLKIKAATRLLALYKVSRLSLTQT